MKRAASLLALLSTAGCADNALLQVELELPRAAGESRYAVVDVLPASAPGWPFDDADVVAVRTAAFALQDDLCDRVESETSDCNVLFAVVAEDPDLAYLAVRIRLCIDPGCESLDDSAPGTLGYLLERPFFRGRRTGWHTDFAPLPSSLPAAGERVGCGGAFPCRIERCAIAGCLFPPPTRDLGYCASDGRHACE